MVTNYNQKDLVSFGNYIADKQFKALKYNPKNNISEGVSHADIENWKLRHKGANKKALNAVNEMCLESLTPQMCCIWDEVRDRLEETRSDLS